MTDPDLSGLTAKRAAFVLAYLGQAMGNATEAARIAGYAKPHPEGARLLRNATIKAALESVNQERIEGAIATAEECQEILTAIARGEIGDPETDLAGEMTGMVPPKAQTRIKAIDQLSKMRGYHAPKKVEHRDYADTPTHVLLAKVAELQGRLAAELEGEVIEARSLGAGGNITTEEESDG